VLALRFDGHAASIVQLIELTGVKYADLLRIGAEARKKGCSDRKREMEWELVEGLHVSAFRRVKDSWHRLDGTVPHHDDKARYLFGPGWSDNSCGIDVIIFCAVQLDIGRIWIDQITDEQAGHLSEPATVLRHLCKKPWGCITQIQRNRLRDVLAEALQSTKPLLFAPGEFLPIHELIDTCFAGVPQASYTFMRATLCCDGILIMPDSVNVTREVGFHMMRDRAGLSSQQILQSSFSDRPATNREPCSQGDQCSLARTSMTMVLDRLPPTLLFHTYHQVSKEDDKIWRFFEPLDITYHTTKGIARARYSPVGCIFWVNQSHFVARWKGRHPTSSRAYGEQIWHYDGMRSGAVREVTDWWAEIGDEKGNTKGSLAMMFYCLA